tara:strand:- start:254 stop:406 length:153 start_codon:yes stop_codon:yes gene_type:complete
MHWQDKVGSHQQLQGQHAQQQYRLEEMEIKGQGLLIWDKIQVTPQVEYAG